MRTDVSPIAVFAVIPPPHSLCRPKVEPEPLRLHPVMESILSTDDKSVGPTGASDWA